MTTITGNTYPVKEKLKAIGARWNAAAKGWDVSDDKVEEAQAIVSGAGPKTKRPYKRTTCVVCGHVEQRQGSHGQYPDPDRILGSGECVSCYEERKMGY